MLINDALQLFSNVRLGQLHYWKTNALTNTVDLVLDQRPISEYEYSRASCSSGRQAARLTPEVNSSAIHVSMSREPVFQCAGTCHSPSVIGLIVQPQISTATVIGHY